MNKIKKKRLSIKEKKRLVGLKKLISPKIWKKIDKLKLYKMYLPFLNEEKKKAVKNIILYYYNNYIKINKRENLINNLRLRWSLESLRIIESFAPISSVEVSIPKEDKFFLDIIFLIRYVSVKYSLSEVYIKYFLLNSPYSFSKDNDKHDRFMDIVRERYYIGRIAFDNYLYKHWFSMLEKNPLISNLLLYFPKLDEMPIKDLIAWIHLVNVRYESWELEQIKDEKNLKIFYWVHRFRCESDFDLSILILIKILRKIAFNEKNKEKYKPYNSNLI